MVENGEVRINSTWQNVGSAPCYRPYRIAWRLANADGQVLLRQAALPLAGLAMSLSPRVAADEQLLAQSLCERLAGAAAAIDQQDEQPAGKEAA